MNIKISRLYLPNAAQARGVVIVIDVIRSATVAAYAFGGGASRLWLVRTIDDAFALRQREPQALLVGEVGGRLIPGFDLNNSPSLMAASDVRGRLLIQRTGSGTRGAVEASSASNMLICSLVNARPTAHYAQELASKADGLITLLPTEEGLPPELWQRAGEDTLCADYLDQLLRGEANASTMLAEKLTRLEASGRFEFLTHGDPDFPFEDIALIKDVDHFDFAMVAKHREWNGITYVEVEKE